RLDTRLQFLPAQIDGGFTGEGIERAGLNAMNQLARLALSRDVVEPPSREHYVFSDAEHAPRQDVEPAEIVEKPAVKLLTANGCLDRVEIEHLETLVRGEWSVVSCQWQLSVVSYPL